MLSNKISSSRGTLFDLPQTRQVEEKQRTAHGYPDLSPNWPRESSASYNNNNNRTKKASQEPLLQNMCPDRENKLSETTYLQDVWFLPISTSQGPKMDLTSFNCRALWLTQENRHVFTTSISLSLSLPPSFSLFPCLLTSHSCYPLLPRVIKYANELCWACPGDCSHSNAAARKHTGGVHYTACSLKLGPVAEHICLLLVALSWVTWWGEEGEQEHCPTFQPPCFFFLFVFLHLRPCVCLSHEVSRCKLWNLLTCWLSSNYSWAN